MTDRILDYCGGVFGASLGDQRPFALPGDKPHYARDRAVDVRHIKLEIEIDPENKRIEGTVHTPFASAARPPPAPPRPFCGGAGRGPPEKAAPRLEPGSGGGLPPLVPLRR